MLCLALHRSLPLAAWQGACTLPTPTGAPILPIQKQSWPNMLIQLDEAEDAAWVRGIWSTRKGKRWQCEPVKGAHLLTVSRPQPGVLSWPCTLQVGSPPPPCSLCLPLRVPSPTLLSPLFPSHNYPPADTQ